MKLLSRGFTKKEKILLLILAIILIALIYYRFVFVETDEQIAAAQSTLSEQESEKMILEAQVTALANKNSEVEKIKNSDNVSYIPSYNANKEELSLLNSILQESESYNISFTDITRNSNLIRRSFSLEFRAKNYDAAKKIINELYSDECRCIIKNIDIKAVESNYKGTKYAQKTSSIANSAVECNITAVFYETMVDGTADAGLPADEDAAKAAEEAASETDTE